MKNALATWKWSLTVIARSPLVLGGLAVLVALWLYGAYRWLWFPMESAGYLFVIGLVWVLVQVAVLAGFLAGTAASARDAAAAGAGFLCTRRLVGFSRGQFVRSIVFVVAAALLVLAVRYLFLRLDHFALEVASFLTFHAEKPVNPETMDKVFGVVEALLWIVVLGFLVSFLLALMREGWREALRTAPRLLRRASWGMPFVTTLLSLLVFGGLACLLAAWHPRVPPGFLDYAQVIARQGVALLLAVAGWLFWLLSLARLTLSSHESGKSDA
jgi:hypothetical protein